MGLVYTCNVDGCGTSYAGDDLPGFWGGCGECDTVVCPLHAANHCCRCEACDRVDRTVSRCGARCDGCDAPGTRILLAVRDLADSYREHPESLGGQQDLLAAKQPTLRRRLRDLLRDHLDDVELLALREAVDELDPRDPTREDAP